MYQLTVTSVRSFMHVTRADHVQTKRNPFSTYIYIHVYMSEQSITGKTATIQSGIIHLSANRVLSEIPGLPRPQTFMYKKVMCLVDDYILFGQNLVENNIFWNSKRREKNQQIQSMHHTLYITYISLVNRILCLNSYVE